jgi:hypothetical protein
VQVWVEVALLAPAGAGVLLLILMLVLGDPVLLVPLGGGVSGILSQVVVLAPVWAGVSGWSHAWGDGLGPLLCKAGMLVLGNPVLLAPFWGGVSGILLQVVMLAPVWAGVSGWSHACGDGLGPLLCKSGMAEWVLLAPAGAGVPCQSCCWCGGWLVVQPLPCWQSHLHFLAVQVWLWLVEKPLHWEQSQLHYLAVQVWECGWWLVAVWQWLFWSALASCVSPSWWEGFVGVFRCSRRIDSLVLSIR